MFSIKVLHIINETSVHPWNVTILIFHCSERWMPKFQRFILRMGPPLSERTVEVTSSSVGTPSSQAFASPGPRICESNVISASPISPSPSDVNPIYIAMFPFFPTLYPREFSPHPSTAHVYVHCSAARPSCRSRKPQAATTSMHSCAGLPKVFSSVMEASDKP